MNKYLYTTETGEPVYTASYSHDLDIPDVPVGYRRIEVSLDTADADLLANQWLDRSDQLVQRPAKPSAFHVWDVAALSWVIDSQMLEKFVETRCRDVDAIQGDLAVRPVEYMGILFDADEKSLGRMRDVLSRLTRGDGLTAGWVGWRTHSNSMAWATSTPDEVKAHLTNIVRMLEDWHQACMLSAWAHKDALIGLGDYESAANYDITSGWPGQKSHSGLTA